MYSLGGGGFMLWTVLDLFKTQTGLFTALSVKNMLQMLQKVL